MPPGDDEQEVNCVVGACCGEPDDLTKRQRALASWLARKTHLTDIAAELVAKALLDGFDFAPHGTLGKLTHRIAELARGNPYR